jgi:hypothetical protein
MWNGFNGTDERTVLKRTANGYVFRVPSRWLIGPARHYLVDESRKDAIVTALAEIRIERAHALIFVVVAALAGLAISISFREHLALAAAFGFALLVVLVALVRFRQLVTLQPLLAQLPPTADRITLRDRLTAASAANSFTQLMMLGIGCAAFSIVNALRLVELMPQADGDALTARLLATGTAAVCFAGIAAADFVLVGLKLRNRPH